MLQGIAPGTEDLAKAGPTSADEHRRTTTVASGALTLIKALKLPATPRVYELCYAYATGEYPTVNIAVNDLLNRHAAVGDAAIEQIAAQYVSHGDARDELHSVGAHVAQEIARVLGSIETMTTTIGTCSEGFANTGEAYSGRQRDAVVAGVKRLLQSSSKIDDEQRKLEAALSASNSEIKSLRDQLQKIRDARGSDPLTRLPNRQEFKPMLAKAIGETVEQGTALCLAVGDIDEFTAFNETWGYDRGDQVLRLVAMEMRQKVGESGTVVRSGGAQFAVILPGASVNEAGSVAENIRRSVMKREVTIRSTGQKLGRIGMSFGIASARRSDTGDSLAARSQACLRSAKAFGRNRVICENDPAIAAVA